MGITKENSDQLHLDSKKHIDDIRKTYEVTNKEFVLRSLERSIDRLQKAFPSRGHFLMEFIQNADDANSTSIKIEIYSDNIRVYNNGDYFSLFFIGLGYKTIPNIQFICF